MPLATTDVFLVAGSRWIIQVVLCPEDELQAALIPCLTYFLTLEESWQSQLYRYSR